MQKILITNDDGIQSDGIIRLARAAKKYGKVWVVAPDGQRSAMSHRITLRETIEFFPVDFPVEGVHAYASTGTPADCVRFGILNIVKEKPDYVFSGINYGYNSGTDIQYSATVGSALEAACAGVHAIAFSEGASECHEVTDAYLEQMLKELMEHYIVKRKYALDGLSTKELCSKLYEDMAGYSFLKKWIYKPGVEEVNINAYNDIEVIESSGRSIKIPDKFSSPQHAIDVIRRMLNACGMVIDDTMPSIVGFLDKNIRISVDKTPIVDADVGVNASIRIVNQQTVSEEKLLNSGSATAEMLHFLTACIRYGVSVCIAGSTGSGKTTIMAWLLSNVPNNRRLITIEEGSREFDLIKRDAQGNILNSVVHLLTRPSANPALNINQDFLLERVLRKHPDVIGVGEMRSAAESLSAAESSRTGHTVCTTIHSNSCNSTYRRMMTLAKRKYNMDDSILMQIMVEAYPIIVFTKQLEDRSRKIMEIIEGEDYRDGRLIAHSLYKYEVEDNVTDDRGETRVVGHHKKIGLISDSLKKRLLDNGISNKELEEFMQPPKEVG